MNKQNQNKKKKEQVTVRSSAAEYLNYVASVGDDEQQIEIRYEDENIWLTQKLMAMLYGVEVHTVNYHIKKIFADSELQEEAVIRKFRITAPDGKQYNTNHYSLEMIIAVGFKVNSEKAVQFRKWVNGIAKEYTIKGWVMDAERLKRGTFLTDKYTRWFADERKNLFTALVQYNSIKDYKYLNIIPKIPSPLFIDVIRKMFADKKAYFLNIGHKQCLYHNAPVNWIRSHSFTPYFCSERDGEGITTQLKALTFDTTKQAKVGCALLNSSLFFIWWICNSDCYHLNKPEITNFRYAYDEATGYTICKIADRLAIDMQNKSVRRVYNYKTSGRVEYDEFYMKLSKPIIDEIDKALAVHYGFTEEELDFIINYDIKYRMGDELNEE